MGRPPSLESLLGKKRKPEGEDSGLNGLEKPKFLSVDERERLVATRTPSVNQKPLKVEKKQVTEDLEVVENKFKLNSERQSVKRSRFRFDWNEDSDTLAGYEPIINTKVSLLVNGMSRGDSLESSRMGKRWQEKTLKEMTDRDWRIFREDFEITTKGGSIENPIRNWHESKILKDDMLDVIVNSLKYKEPTPIQRIAIPNICKRGSRDFLGVASTGSGKTLAFVIPILIKMISSEPRPPALKSIEGPKALILAPTRELAQQIQAESERITKLWNVKNPEYSCRVVSVVGGHSLEETTYNLQKGCDILVATPGRLIDSLESHILTIKQVETLVLDEADRMIDLGFEEQVTKIFNILESTSEQGKIQKLMFTATMSPSIERIANGYLQKPSYATIGRGEGSIPQIQQLVYYSGSEEQRFRRVKSLLEQYVPPVIVFVTYKKTADWLVQKFNQETSFRVTVLHGSKSQDQREHSLQLLRSGKAQVMIATNVAARGLDIPNVSLVVNFQISKQFEDYIHRIGRTGRAGMKGTAITFLGDDENTQIVEEISKYIKHNNPTNSNVFDKTLREKYNIENHQMDELIY